MKVMQISKELDACEGAKEVYELMCKIYNMSKTIVLLLEEDLLIPNMYKSFYHHLHTHNNTNPKRNCVVLFF